MCVCLHVSCVCVFLCSAGVIALDLARELLSLHPEKIALVVSHENITNNFYAGECAWLFLWLPAHKAAMLETAAAGVGMRCQRAKAAVCLTPAAGTSMLEARLAAQQAFHGGPSTSTR